MISIAKWTKLQERLTEAGLLEKDLEEHFIRSAGHGGQNVNKVNTCVHLTHVPTRLSVKCQKTRSQADNRYFARELLLEKWQATIARQQTKRDREIYKIRKQKKRRSRKLKEKILKEKHHRSKLKIGRQKPSTSFE